MGADEPNNVARPTSQSKRKPDWYTKKETVLKSRDDGSRVRHVTCTRAGRPILYRNSKSFVFIAPTASADQ